MRGRRCIGWRAHPWATPSTTMPPPCPRAHGDERQGDLRRRPWSWGGGEGYRDEEKCRGKARQPSKLTEVGQGPQTPQGQEQGKSPDKKEKSLWRHGSRPETATDLRDEGSWWTESPPGRRREAHENRKHSLDIGSGPRGQEKATDRRRGPQKWKQECISQRQGGGPSKVGEGHRNGDGWAQIPGTRKHKDVWTQEVP